MSQSDFRQMSSMPSHGAASKMLAGNARESYQTEEESGRENFHMKAGAPGYRGEGVPLTGHPAARRAGRMAAAHAPDGAGQYMQQQCHFPQAPPARCYCQPAPFTSLAGMAYFRIVDAYGNSRPCPSFY